MKMIMFFELAGTNLYYYALTLKIENRQPNSQRKLLMLSMRNYNRSSSITYNTKFGTCSIQENPADFENCLIYADNAMYKAKSNGRNGYVIYNSILEESYKDKLTLKMDIEKALENNEFYASLPTTNQYKNGQIVGVEALIR